MGVCIMLNHFKGISVTFIYHFIIHINAQPCTSTVICHMFIMHMFHGVSAAVRLCMVYTIGHSKLYTFIWWLYYSYFCILSIVYPLKWPRHRIQAYKCTMHSQCTIHHALAYLWNNVCLHTLQPEFPFYGRRK